MRPSSSFLAVLRELYVLDRRSMLFRWLRDLWDADETAQPAPRLLCSLAHDPLLRATAGPVLDIPLGRPVDAGMLSAGRGRAISGYPTANARLGCVR
jgi:hypothetical protein